MKKLLMGTVLLATLAVAGLFLVEFDSPTLGRAVLERASAATGFKMQAAKFSLSLWRGVVLHDLEVKGAVGASQLQVRAARLVLQHRWLPLLTGKIAVSTILLDSPQVELRERKSGKRPFPGSAARPKNRGEADFPPAGEAREEGGSASGGPPLALEISEIR
ncbi:MAG: AsmA family protein, partial [Acidobacteria bacterium]|nr:AsmA family protein [Acidobacteriota bacterium]